MDQRAGIEAKFKRVDESIDNLEAEVHAFVAGEQKPYRLFKDFQNEGRDYVITVFGEPTAPHRFAVLSGEIVHHLRSCLDHLVVALVKEAGNPALNQHQFPVKPTKDKFDKAVNGGCLNGIRYSALNLIEQAQPYHNATPDDYFLTVLNEFDVIDKHRLLIVTVQAVSIADTVVIGTDGEVAKRLGISPGRMIVNFTHHNRRKIDVNGAELFRIHLRDPDPTFKADADIVADVAFEKAGRAEIIPVIGVLRGMRNATRDLIARFLGEFN